MKLVQFGAGNIGRSFIGQIFSRAGWDVVFVDVNANLVRLLNEKRAYTVVIKREGEEDERRLVSPVRAVAAEDTARVVEEVATSDLVASSVGKAALAGILPVIAAGLRSRWKQRPGASLDIVIAENVRGAAAMCRETLEKELGGEFHVGDLVGLVETSIGKMVPIMRSKDLEQDPLQVFAEEYETLILDKRGFRGKLPRPGDGWPSSIQLVEDIQAFVDRKLFVHNLGHAAAAYLGYRSDPSVVLLADVLSIPAVEAGTRGAMEEAADALAEEYPHAYGRNELQEHIDELIHRFCNRALGDTVHRVGRDLYRKLDREDRLVGAMLLCAKHNLPFPDTAEAWRAALEFSAPDEQGRVFPSDMRFRTEALPRGLEYVLRHVCHLDPGDPVDRRVWEALR